MAERIVLSRGSVEIREDFAEELLQVLFGGGTEEPGEFVLAWDEALPVVAPRIYDVPLAHAGAA